MMHHGVDCFSTIHAGYPEQLRAAGYSFFARYYRRAPLEGGRGNALSRAEAARLFAAGFWALAIYQNASDTPGYFTPANAKADAQAAVAAAAHHGQPKDTTIYFAVDCNPTPADLATLINYFLTVKEVLWQAGYYTGVYGSGLVCKVLTDEGITHRTWLANARGWTSYAEWFPKADVVQTTRPFILPFGLEVDANSCRNLRYAGMWRPDMVMGDDAPTPGPTAKQEALISKVLGAISRIFGRGAS